MDNLIKINTSDFQTTVLQAKEPVLVDFGATWCGPCKMLDPIVSQLAQEWTGKAKFVRVDVDECPEIAASYQVMGVPTLMMFVKGQVVERISGFQPKERVAARFRPHLS